MSTSRHGGDVRVRLAADADGARAAAEWVREALLDASPEDALACELAVAEVANNVVLHHATAGTDGSDGAFTVVLRARPARFAAAVCNVGPPFAPQVGEMPEAESDGGRGLPLIDACMERVRFAHVDGQNRVLMTRRLAPGDDPSPLP